MHAEPIWSGAHGVLDWHAGLGMNLAMGAVSSSVGNWFSGPKPDGPDGKPAYQGYLTEQNAEKLADALCRMRGAALKLGQMISIQDESVLPPQVCLARLSPLPSNGT